MAVSKEQNSIDLEKDRKAKDASREANWLKSLRTSSQQDCLDAGRQKKK